MRDSTFAFTVIIMKKRLFVDLDGTLAHFARVAKIEALYEKGYFLNLPPYQKVIDAIRIINNHPDIEVFILSAVLSDSQYALTEKSIWCDTHTPFIKPEQRVFTVCGKNKADFIKGSLSPSDFLLDDYTINLYNWTDNGGQGIKLINEINSTHGTWKGKRVKYNDPPEKIAKQIIQEIEKAPIPQEVKSSPKRTIFECSYSNSNKKTSKVFILAYDKLDAECSFYLYMKDTDKLINNSIKQVGIKQINNSDKCLNFKNPHSQPQR